MNENEGFLFDRAKPLYPVVMMLLTGIHGWFELWSRSAILRVKKAIADGKGRNEIEAELEGINSDLAKRALKEGASSGVTPLLFRAQFKSKVQPQPLEIDVDQISHELFDSGHYLSGFVIRAVSGSLIVAHEMTRKFQSKKDSEWEFLRHCRNAAAHGDVFDLRDGEPKQPAEWRGLRITRQLNGTRLFATDDQEGLLLPGDVILLYQDLQHKTEPVSA
jgi:hypothetical protein